MNFNSMGPLRSLARKAYSPSTDFIINHFSAAKSLTDYIDRNAEQQVSEFIDRFNESTNRLDASTLDLKQLYLKTFQNRKVKIDSESLTAVAKNSSALEQYKVTVKQLATTQLDNSKSYDQDASNLANFGNIDLTINQKNTSIDISVDTEGATENQDILKKTATAINQSDADIKARVLTDNDGTARLSVESTATGKDAAFQITGGFSDYIQLNTVSSAKDAQYTLNDEAFTSSENTVTHDDGQLEITFNDEIDKSQTVQVTLDDTPIAQQLSSLTEQLQHTAKFLEDYQQESPLVAKYGRRLDYIVNHFEEDLEAVGIQMNDENYFSFNKEIFQTNFSEKGATLIKKLDEAGNFIDQLSKFTDDLKVQNMQTLVPANPKSTLPVFKEDDFISYLSLSSSFNINTFYPTGNILNFTL